VIKKKNKHVEEKKALIKALIFFLLLFGGIAAVLVWAAKSEQSALAETIRKTVGIKTPEREMPAQPVTEMVVELAPVPEVVAPPEPEREPTPAPIPEISFSEVSKSRHLWPDTLELNASKQVSIRYQEREFGYMQFDEGTEIKVHALKAPVEIYASINGNFISLSVTETNFPDWFNQNYSGRYVLQSMGDSTESGEATADLSDSTTATKEKNFWNEMRLWCHTNYDSISLEIGEEQLTFRWLPKEDVPIDFQMEAREIARTYLLIRSRLGGNENYAACEIVHPTTGERLGASSIFIPRL